MKWRARRMPPSRPASRWAGTRSPDARRPPRPPDDDAGPIGYTVGSQSRPGGAARMDALKIHELPSLRSPTLIAAFAGWPDAGEVASGSARYLARKLRARRFAELDPEEFYVFTETRPTTIILAPGQRALEWPTNEFFAWRDPVGVRDLVILQGREPNVNWRGYIDA